jgi:hypothetical protein
MSWPDAKADFQTRYQSISSYIQNGLLNDIQNLSQATANYIAKGGISHDPSENGDFNTIMKTSSAINNYKQQFQQLNTDMTRTINTISSDSDMGSLLLENAKLQQTIQSLEKQKEVSEEDAKSSVLRDDLLRSKDKNITSHQLFLLGRPLRPNSIPYIWAFAILFIGVGLLIFQQMSPIPNLFEKYGEISSEQQGQYGQYLDFLSFLGDARVWGTLSGALIIVVIFLSLKIANIL